MKFRSLSEEKKYFFAQKQIKSPIGIEICFHVENISY